MRRLREKVTPEEGERAKSAFHDYSAWELSVGTKALDFQTTLFF